MSITSRSPGAVWDWPWRVWTSRGNDRAMTWHAVRPGGGGLASRAPVSACRHAGVECHGPPVAACQRLGARRSRTVSIDTSADMACQYLLDLSPRERLRKAGVLSGHFWLTL